jgi:molybdopterin-guanine dinucleotide biosynthesis protein A
MGTDKALLRLSPGGPRLLEMVLAAVQPLVTDIVISTNHPDAYAWTGLPLVADNFPHRGPLAGLEAGLAASNAAINLVVACDMPWLETALLAFLLGQAPGYQAVVPLNAEGRAEPLCAVYSKAGLPVIRRHLAEDSLKMSDLLDDVKTLFVPAQKLAEFDPELRSFRNLNRPTDLPVMYNE